MADFTARTLRPPSAPVHRTVFVPARPCAAVLLIGGSGGSEPFYVGDALAREGVAALSVAYFARLGLPDQLRAISFEYFFSPLEILHAELPGAPLAGARYVVGKRSGDADRDPFSHSRTRGGCDGSREHRGGQLAIRRTSVAPRRPGTDAWPKAVEFIRKLGYTGAS